MTSVTVSVVTDAARVAEAYALRTEVFVVEQGVDAAIERDERDPEADHVLATVDGRPTGAGRLLVEPAGFEGVDPAFGAVGHLGRLVVLADARGQGLGAALVRAIEDRAAERGLRCVYLGAQTYAVPFYERLGYAAYGEAFAGADMPHRHMWRPLDPARHPEPPESPGS
jgi:predicted GNAT family N-acyltransferase